MGLWKGALLPSENLAYIHSRGKKSMATMDVFLVTETQSLLINPLPKAVSCINFKIQFLVQNYGLFRQILMHILLAATVYIQNG